MWPYTTGARWHISQPMCVCVYVCVRVTQVRLWVGWVDAWSPGCSVAYFMVDLPSAFVYRQMCENVGGYGAHETVFLTQRWWHSHLYSVYYRIFVPPLNLYHSSPMPRQQFSMCVCVHVCVLGLLCYCWQLSRIYTTSLHCHPMAFQ